MSRLVAGVDRIVAMLLGLGLIAGGLLAIAWQEGRLPQAPARLRVPELLDATRSSWWRYALIAAAALLLVAGLAWLGAHRPGRRLRSTRRSRSGDGTILGIAEAATAAAEEFGRQPGVTSASGRARMDRGGRRTIDLSAAVDPRVDLTAMAAAADAALAGAVSRMADEPPATRTLLRLSDG